ncbi:MAG: hypothetical protein JNK25_13270 [Phycisphaerae bacterium]|nr:hypothetical protein [Phycisphaerae bacterium]
MSSTINNGANGGGTTSTGTGDDPYREITRDQASTLLRIGLEGPRRAADDLADELEKCDGLRWFESQFRRPPFAELPHAGRLLLSGGTSLDALTALKERAKSLVKNPTTREEYLAGLAGYYLAIASAIAHHGARISRQPAEELEPVLQELAAVAPQPWSDLLLAAAKKV